MKGLKEGRSKDPQGVGSSPKLLVAIVRLLARQAARATVAQSATVSEEDPS